MLVCCCLSQSTFVKDKSRQVMPTYHLSQHTVYQYSWQTFVLIDEALSTSKVDPLVDEHAFHGQCHQSLGEGYARFTSSSMWPPLLIFTVRVPEQCFCVIQDCGQQSRIYGTNPSKHTGKNFERLRSWNGYRQCLMIVRYLSWHSADGHANGFVFAHRLGYIMD